MTVACLTPDVNMIRTAWDAINQPGEVREIRIPGPKQPAQGRPRFYGVQAGWFDNTDDVVHAVGDVTGDQAESVYVTVNPTKPDLLARVKNRITKQKSTTADDNIVRLTYLFVDIDADRLAQIPATDEEKAEALASRDAIVEYLCDVFGWPCPFMSGDSGNGGALLYRIDLENSPETKGLLERVLKALHQTFPAVDETTFNPARIMKLPGTIAAKGDGLEHRPHRRSSATFNMAAELVTREMLEQVAHEVEEKPIPARSNGHYDGPDRAWTMEELLSLNALPVDRQEKPYGTAFKLDRCLTSQNHMDGAVLIECNSGAIAYRCHHNSCTGKDWNYLRENGLIRIPNVPTGSITLNGRSISTDAPGRSTANERDNSPPSPQHDWPDSLAPEAFHGLAGDVVREVEPHTEADPAGLLFTFLAEVGNAVGVEPYWAISGSKHGLRIWPILVGETAKARKGTTHGALRRIFQTAAPNWFASSVTAGLSSGEGLIWAVRDPIYKQSPIKENGRIVDYQEEMTDPGVEDKRLLVLEEEFSSTLRVMGRDGNSLSGVIRQAWDHGDLNTLTKNNPAKATGAHITIIGHTTQDELLRYLNDTEAANGFANRFVWVAVRRSKLLPDGGNLDNQTIFDLGLRLEAALKQASEITLIERDENAHSIWREVYGPLSEGRAGLLGAITSRAEAQTMRIAAIYALLDGSSLIRPEHLMAALAVWKYAEDSAAFIFGDSLGDPVADTIIRALRASGEMSRTDISNFFGRNVSAGRLDGALGSLLAANKVEREHVSTGGRPKEVWRAR